MTSLSSIIETYFRGPELLRNVVTRNPEDVWDARPIEGKWSIREVVCHLADSEIVYADRMKRVLAEENPTFFEADPNLFGTALHTSERCVENELKVIEAVRAHMLPILQSCDVSDFSRIGVHSIDGKMTLQTLLERIAMHIPHHIKFIEEKLHALQG